MNKYTETAYFMQKDSRKFGTLYYLLYVGRQEEAAEIECVAEMVEQIICNNTISLDDIAL